MNLSQKHTGCSCWEWIQSILRFVWSKQFKAMKNTIIHEVKMDEIRTECFGRMLEYKMSSLFIGNNESLPVTQAWIQEGDPGASDPAPYPPKVTIKTI